MYVNGGGSGERRRRRGGGPRCIRKGAAWWMEAEGAKDGHSVAGLKHIPGRGVATSPALKQHRKVVVTWRG